MDTLNCTNCGVFFGMPDGYLDNRRGDKVTFYCPNGHKLTYTDSAADKLRRDLQRAQQQIARAEDEAREAKFAVAAEVRKRLRLEKRIHHGVCPCCTRSFANVARHMKTKHPNVTPLKATA